MSWLRSVVELAIVIGIGIGIHGIGIHVALVLLPLPRTDTCISSGALSAFVLGVVMSIVAVFVAGLWFLFSEYEVVEE